MNNEAWETLGGALRVIPAETRLTVYRRRPVLLLKGPSWRCTLCKFARFVETDSDYEKISRPYKIESSLLNFDME